MTYRDVARKLAALGCTELPRHGGGSHRKWFNPATDRATVLPEWGGRDLKVGTVRAADPPTPLAKGGRGVALDCESFEQA